MIVPVNIQTTTNNQASGKDSSNPAAISISGNTVYVHTGSDSKADQLMRVIDVINVRMGKHTAKLAGKGFKPHWAMKRNQHSPAYTTDIHQLATVSAC